MIKEAAYWIALSHLPKWGYLKINNLVIDFYYKQKLSIEEFFNLYKEDWKDIFNLNVKDIETLEQTKSEIPADAFIAESLYNSGIELIPIISSIYPKTLRNNLKSKYSPTLLYVKGNLEILKEKSIAIVGSRNASDKSLKFAENIAKSASKEFKVIVSGFAKGIDKKALDTAVNNNGQSIIVLPQGILTFEYGFKNYYKQIVEGNVLVLSTFFPKVQWKAELAMARNPIIYGLADEIYVAESSDRGGTWSGVIDGLRKGRKIFIRKPDENEKNANELLIQKGAIPVDFNGKPIVDYKESDSSSQLLVSDTNIDEKAKIYNLLKTGSFSIKEIINKLKFSWSEKQLKDFLKMSEDIEIVCKRPLKFTLSSSLKGQTMMF